MEYIKIKRGRVTSAGRRFAELYHVRKPRKFAKPTSEKSISRKSCLFITGQGDSGKSRTARRLFEASAEIWPQRGKALWLGGRRPLTSWTNAAVEQWWDALAKSEASAGTAGARPKWASLKDWQRVDALAEYVTSTRAVVFIDDAHALQGRKLEVAKGCAVAAGIWVMTAHGENRISPSLRGQIQRRQSGGKLWRMHMGTTAAYDATTPILWTLVAGAALAGLPEMALVLGGLGVFSRGRGASRPD